MNHSLKKYDAIIVGGGHNGLVAAGYLAKAGKSVLLLEAHDELGGATTSVKPFPDYDANLSRYSYLVSLLPDQIVTDLGINFNTLDRAVASDTPYSRQGNDDGLLVSTDWDEATADSFLRLTGSTSFPALQSSPRLRPAGRSGPMALSGASRRKQTPGSQETVSESTESLRDIIWLLAPEPQAARRKTPRQAGNRLQSGERHSPDPRLESLQVGILNRRPHPGRSTTRRDYVDCKICAAP